MITREKFLEKLKKIFSGEAPEDTSVFVYTNEKVQEIYNYGNEGHPKNYVVCLEEDYLDSMIENLGVDGIIEALKNDSITEDARRNNYLFDCVDEEEIEELIPPDTPQTFYANTLMGLFGQLEDEGLFCLNYEWLSRSGGK